MLSPGKDALCQATYECHRPEQTLLYQLVDKHYPVLVEELDTKGQSLPTHVHREFEAYLKCGRLEHGFLRVRCDKCRFERLVAFSCKKRGYENREKELLMSSPSLRSFDSISLYVAVAFAP